MSEKICSFCGHKDCDYLMRTQIKDAVIDLIENNNITVFYSGGMGVFDTLCESVVRELKRKYNIKLCLVVPHFTQRLNKDKKYYAEMYDEIIVPDLGNIHHKREIIARNRWMAERSDMLLCYVVRNTGGAYQMLQYARKMNKAIGKLCIPYYRVLNGR